MIWRAMNSRRKAAPARVTVQHRRLHLGYLSSAVAFPILFSRPTVLRTRTMYAYVPLTLVSTTDVMFKRFGSLSVLSPFPAAVHQLGKITIAKCYRHFSVDRIDDIQSLPSGYDHRIRDIELVGARPTA